MRCLVTAFVLLLLSPVAVAAEESREAERLQKAATIINEIMETTEKGIPRDLLKKAVCVGVIPSQKKFENGSDAAAYARGRSHSHSAALLRRNPAGYPEKPHCRLSRGWQGASLKGESLRYSISPA